MDTGRFLKAPEQGHDSATDKYTASIELSNACRQFYQARVEAANCIKTRWQKHSHKCNDNDRPTTGSDNSSSSCTSNISTTTTTTTSSSSSSQRRQRNSIDAAMEKLRVEMTSLMEQDLSLMKQLLTLNETIEDLKWQRRYYYSRSSLHDSSAEMVNSDSSLSDMYDSEDDLHHKCHASSSSSTKDSTTTPSTNTATTTCKSPRIVLSPPKFSSSSSCITTKSRRGQAPASSGHVLSSAHAHAHGEGKLLRVSGKVYHSEQDSLDSGIHESCSSGEEEAVV